MRKLVILLLLVNLVSCSPNIGKIHYPARDKKNNGKAFAKLYESMRLDVPETWYFGPKDPHHFRVKYSPLVLKNVPFENNCIIEVTPFELKDTTSETFNSKIDELKEFYLGHDNFESSFVKKEDALVVQNYQYTYKENVMKGVKRYVRSGNTLYLLVYVGNTKVFDQYKQEAIQILDSFRLKKD